MNWKHTVTVYGVLVCFGFTSCTTSSEHPIGNSTGRGRFVSVAHDGGGRAKVWLGVNPQPDETFIWKGPVDADGYIRGVGSFATFRAGDGLTTFSTGRAIHGRMEGDSVKYVHWAPLRSVWLITLANGKLRREVKVADTMEEWARLYQGNSEQRAILADQFPNAFAPVVTPEPKVESSDADSSRDGSSSESPATSSGVGAIIAVAVIAGVAYAAYKAFTGGGSSTPSYADYDDDSGGSETETQVSSSSGRVYFKAPSKASTESVGYHQGSSIYTSDNTWVGTEKGNSFYKRDGTYVGKYEGNRVYSVSGDWLGDFKNGTVLDSTGEAKAFYSVPSSGDEAAALALGLFTKP